MQMTKGDDHKNDDDVYIAGIHLPRHGNAIECFGVTRDEADTRRDAIISSQLDTARLDFIMPVIGGEDDADTNLRTAALMGALISGLAGREAIDAAIQSYKGNVK